MLGRYTAQYFLKTTIINESTKKKVRKQRQPKAAKVAGEDDEDGFQFITQRHRKKEKVLFQQGTHGCQHTSATCLNRHFACRRGGVGGVDR